jgi:hypothetical protein
MTIDRAAASGSAMGTLSAMGIGMAPGGVLNMDGGVRLLSLGTAGAGSGIYIAGSMTSFTAIAMAPNASLEVSGNIGTFLVGTVGSGALISAGGSIGQLKTTGDLGASITAGLGIGTVTVCSGTLSGAIATGGGISLITVNGNASVTVRAARRLGTFTMGGTGTAPRTLNGLFDCQAITSLNAANTDVNHLTMRAPDGIGTINVRSMSNSLLSAGAISNLLTSADLSNSMILCGYDIGADLAFGTADDGAFIGGAATGSIGVIWVGGNMSGSSVAANIAPGADGRFGTADDVVLSSSLQGAISALMVRGTLTGSANPSEHFGVVAHKTLGFVSAGGKLVPLPALLGNLTVAANWR